MSLRLNGSTSGYTEIDAPANAGSNTLRLPVNNGSDGNILGTDGSGNLSWVNGRMTIGTAKPSTSGSNIDFSPTDGTGIPSWAKRVTVILNEVSLSASANLLVQLGTSGGLNTNGYASTSTSAATTVGTVSSASGFIISFGATAVMMSGHLLLTKVSGDTWIGSHVCGRSDAASTRFGGGSITLGGTLTQLRITSTSTDTFDAGSINILYEG